MKFRVLVVLLLGLFPQPIVAEDINNLISEDSSAIRFRNATSFHAENVVCHGFARLENFRFLNGQKFIVLHPNEVSTASVDYFLEEGQDFAGHQIVVGYDKLGAQATVYKGAPGAKGHAIFELKAPSEPGKYFVRFISVAATNEDEASNLWNIHAPSGASATIGKVIVEKPNKEVVLNLVSKKIVWGKRFGPWKFGPSTSGVSVAAYPNISKSPGKYTLFSKGRYSNFKLDFKVSYKINSDADLGDWAHARGFGLFYQSFNGQGYLPSKFLYFHYFPDVQQLSLYIEDQNVSEEKIIKPFYLPEDSDIHFSISVINGHISWKVNGEEVFQNSVTTIKSGELAFDVGNNAVVFKDISLVTDLK